MSDFFGCCNPAHFAILPDGRFVTSEKGIPRIKVYSAQGQFECVVAGPEQLAVDSRQLSDPRLAADKRVFDVAVDSRGRVLVLDPQARSVRVYVRSRGSGRSRVMTNDRWPPRGRRAFLVGLVRQLLLVALALFTGYLLRRRPLGCPQRARTRLPGMCAVVALSTARARRDRTDGSENASVKMTNSDPPSTRTVGEPGCSTDYAWRPSWPWAR